MESYIERERERRMPTPLLFVTGKAHALQAMVMEFERDNPQACCFSSQFQMLPGEGQRCIEWGRWWLTEEKCPTTSMK